MTNRLGEKRKPKHTPMSNTDTDIRTILRFREPLKATTDKDAYLAVSFAEDMDEFESRLDTCSEEEKREFCVEITDCIWSVKESLQIDPDMMNALNDLHSKYSIKGLTGRHGVVSAYKGTGRYPDVRMFAFIIACKNREALDSILRTINDNLLNYINTTSDKSNIGESVIDSMGHYSLKDFVSIESHITVRYRDNIMFSIDNERIRSEFRLKDRSFFFDSVSEVIRLNNSTDVWSTMYQSYVDWVNKH